MVSAPAPVMVDSSAANFSRNCLFFTGPSGPFFLLIVGLSQSRTVSSDMVLIDVFIKTFLSLSYKNFIQPENCRLV